MAMGLGPAEGEDDDLVASINTTPLVDIMLVLLIIFLITVPVVTHTVNVQLPREVNKPTQTRPENITLAVDKDGNVYWNEVAVADNASLLKRLEDHATANPQPEVHIRADRDVRYESVGRIVVDCQRAGIAKIAFIIEPDRGSATTGGS
jgi:biopolymer transport protein ExbD